MPTNRAVEVQPFRLAAEVAEGHRVNVCLSMRPPGKELPPRPGWQLENSNEVVMAQNRLPGEDSEALERRLRRIDLALAIAAGALSLGLFYLALFPG